MENFRLSVVSFCNNTKSLYSNVLGKFAVTISAFRIYKNIRIFILIIFFFKCQHYDLMSYQKEPYPDCVSFSALIWHTLMTMNNDNETVLECKMVISKLYTLYIRHTYIFILHLQTAHVTTSVLSKLIQTCGTDTRYLNITGNVFKQ